MASFKVIAGDFGQGSGQVFVGRPYRVSAQGFQMPDLGHSFQTEHIGLGQIAALEMATEEGLKKMAGSVGWGLAGGLALGPIGALAGVLAGGRKTEITFICQFKDGRKFLGSSNAATFTCIQAAMFKASVVPKRTASPVGSAVVVLALLVLLGMVVFLANLDPAKPTAKATDSLNQPALKLVTALVIDDIKTSLTRDQKSAAWPKVEDLMTFLKLNWIITAKDYEAKYDDNEIAADNDFKGQRILISGKVVSVDKDFTESGVVILRGSGFMGVRAELSEAGMRAGASFTKGQKVNLVCRGGERIVTVATLVNCESLEDYLNQLSPSIEVSVAQFLKDGMGLGNVNKTMVVGMYIAGLHLAPDSLCLNGALEHCLSEFATLSKDKTRTDAIHDETAKMMASLNSK